MIGMEHSTPNHGAHLDHRLAVFSTNGQAISNTSAIRMYSQGILSDLPFSRASNTESPWPCGPPKTTKPRLYPLASAEGSTAPLSLGFSSGFFLEREMSALNQNTI
jgi:hypothetical protein